MKQHYLDIRLQVHQWPYETWLYSAIPGLELAYEDETLKVFAALLNNVSRSTRAVLGELCIAVAEYSAVPLNEEE